MPESCFDNSWVSDFPDDGVISFDDTLNITKDGAVTATVNITVRRSLLFQVIRRLSIEGHPYYAGMTLEGINSTGKPAGVVDVSATFRSVSAELATGPGGQGQEDWRMSGASTESPISTHPEFLNWTDSGNAIFEDVLDDNDQKVGEIFIRYKTVLAGGASNPKAGVTSWLQGQWTLSVSKTFTNAGAAQSFANAGQVGRINNPTGTPSWVPSPTSGRNYLLLNSEIEEFGEGARVTKIWLLSGRGGWDTDIYG